MLSCRFDSMFLGDERYIDKRLTEPSLYSVMMVTMADSTSLRTIRELRDLNTSSFSWVGEPGSSASRVTAILAWIIVQFLQLDYRMECTDHVIGGSHTKVQCKPG